MHRALQQAERSVLLGRQGTKEHGDGQEQAGSLEQRAGEIEPGVQTLPAVFHRLSGRLFGHRSKGVRGVPHDNLVRCGSANMRDQPNVTGDSRNAQVAYYREGVDPEEEITRPRGYPAFVRWLIRSKIES